MDMHNLLHNSYAFECVDKNPDHYKYDFVSIGTAAEEIPKRVSIRNMHYDGWYNLGFGDFSIAEDGSESVDDQRRNIGRANPDTILNTALLCGAHFLISTANTRLLFYGNTIVKHRLYKIKICRRIDELSEYFVIKGGTIQNTVFRDEDGFKLEVEGLIDPNTLEMEVFEKSRSHQYHFLTFEIREFL